MEIEITKIEEKKEKINIDLPYYYKVEDTRGNHKETTLGKITKDKHIILTSYIANNINMEDLEVNVEREVSPGKVPAYLYDAEYKITEEEFYDYVESYQRIFDTI